MIIPNIIYGKIKFMFQTTNQSWIIMSSVQKQSSCEWTRNLKQTTFWGDKKSPRSPHLPLLAHFRRTGSQTSHLHLNKQSPWGFPEEITGETTPKRNSSVKNYSPNTCQQWSRNIRKTTFFSCQKQLFNSGQLIPKRSPFWTGDMTFFLKRCTVASRLNSRTLVRNSQDNTLHYSKGWHWKPFEMYMISQEKIGQILGQSPANAPPLSAAPANLKASCALGDMRSISWGCVYLCVCFIAFYRKDITYIIT